MSDLFKCGFCDILFGLMRRAVCSRNSRGSNDTCYRELSGENSVRRPRINLTSSSESTYDLTGPGRYEKELAKIYPKTVTKSFKPSQYGNFKSMTCLSSHGKRAPTTSIIDDSYPIEAEVLLTHSELWEFDSFHLDLLSGGHCLPTLGLHLFKKYDLISHFNLQPENCWKLFHLIERNYQQNPYHNSIHASDVAQAVHCFVQQPPLLQYLLKIEILVLLLAAFTHDLDHPGVNQSYLIATHHPLAVMYKDNAMGKNDRSPLPQTRKVKLLQRLKFYKTDSGSEKLTSSKKSAVGTSSWRKKKTQDHGSILECHHWRMAFGCISESGIFANMAAQQNTIITMLRDLILATDITRQHTYLEQFRILLTRQSLDMNLAEHRLMVMQIALKTADISNPGRPWAISQKWSEKVCEEFFTQGDKERKMNIPISKLCDRSQDTVPNIQIGFFENVVMPLYTEWHRYLKSELSLKIMNNVVLNAAEWKRQAQLSNTKEMDEEISRAHPGPLSVRTNHSVSTERLLQEAGASAPHVGQPEAPRRNSCSPTRASKDVLRRLSVPLHALVEPPRVTSEVLQRGEPSAQRTPRRSAEEIHRSRTVSRLELANTIEAECSRSASRESSHSHESAPLPRPAASTPMRASLPPLLLEIQTNSSPRPCAGLPAKDTDSTNVVRFGSFAMAVCDSDTKSTSDTTTAYPQQLSTVTGSSFTPSNDSRLYLPIMLDNASTCAAGSCEAVVKHVASCEESCDVLPRLIAPEMMRRRGSAPVVVAMSTTRRQTVYTEPRKLSASCNVIAGAIPLVRRGSLPVMTGISAL